MRDGRLGHMLYVVDFYWYACHTSSLHPYLKVLKLGCADEAISRIDTTSLINAI